jgi:hypothetical protein
MVPRYTTRCFRDNFFDAQSICRTDAPVKLNDLINNEQPRVCTQVYFSQVVQECLALGMQPLYLDTLNDWKCFWDAVWKKGVNSSAVEPHSHEKTKRYICVVLTDKAFYLSAKILV